MKNFKLHLLAACAVSSVSFGAAQAQVALPASDLHGAGASSIEVAMPQAMNCIGIDNPLAIGSTGTTQAVPVGNFVVTSPTASNPSFDCASQNIQPAFSAQYVSTGSGFGRKMWSLFSNQFTTTLPVVAGKTYNAFVGPINGSVPAWNNLQFAFSDGGISSTELTTYNTNAAPSAGPAIQIPLYVLPVAIAYNPTYGRNTLTATDLKFRVKTPVLVGGVSTGGLRLKTADYCKIFNGEITNWKDIPVINNGKQSLMDLNDSVARWNSDGVPIRLVGRADSSGTTDIFTRHLAKVCGAHVTVNKFAGAAGGLPYNVTSGPNVTGTIYLNTAAQTGFAGTVTSISGAVFSGGAISGTEAPGLFMVGSGSGSVRDAINLAADKPSASLATTLLNGKIGYIGADFVAPVPGSTLHAAALQVGTSTAFAMPTAKNGTAAIDVSLLPPQTTATNGAYNTADTRISSATGVALDRAQPRDWVAALYPSTGTTLANPTKGYPVTGTTMLLTYTCFASAANRLALVEFLLANAKKITKNSLNAPVSSNTFSGTGATALGLTAQLGLAPMPTSWLNAMNETFLKASTQSSGGATLGSRNLWIQNKQPTNAATLATTTGNVTVCAGKVGA